MLECAWVRALVVIAVVASCGRWNFDPLDDSGTQQTSGDGLPATSCGSLSATCGPMGNESCCAAPVVSGGTFYREYDVAADMTFPDMSYPATVSTFRLDRYEVSVGRFRQFVAGGFGTMTNPPVAGAGGRRLNGMENQAGWDSAWNPSLAADTTALEAALKCNGFKTWTDAPAGNENRPIVCITWYEAMAFCAWDGGFLPTLAESMYAASGGSEQRAYPWSSPAGSTTIDCGLTNYGSFMPPTTECVVGGSSSVGANSPAGDGKWGQADLSGNVWEYVVDADITPLPTPCIDCASLSSSGLRLEHGGSFIDTEESERSATYGLGGTGRFNYEGFRCARAP
jgi:formylglycine-generating enzyme